IHFRRCPGHKGLNILQGRLGLPRSSRVVTLGSMRILPAIPSFFLLLCACTRSASAAEPSADTATPSGRQRLAADTSRTTADGATFVAPRDWWVETRTNAIILMPEGDSRLALVDVHAKDADAAGKSA